MFCRCCGEPIDKYDKFCIHCGEKLVPIVQNAIQAAPPVQNVEGINSQSKETKWSLIVGIIALVITFFQPLIGFILGIIAIVRSSKEHQKAALVLGIIAVVLSCIRFFTGIIVESYIEQFFYDFCLLI